MILAIVVGSAGSVGAVTRYLLDGMIQDRTSKTFPYGILVINVVGSFILGAVTEMALKFGLPGSVSAVVGAGFCGALTTWSTASWETVRLAEEGFAAQALMAGVGGLVTSMIAAGVAMALVAAVSFAF
ncbi:MAG: fluoride efflux transporter FluC [Acidimicrobiales bacterium]